MHKSRGCKVGWALHEVAVSIAMICSKRSSAEVAEVNAVLGTQLREEEEDFCDRHAATTGSGDGLCS